MRHHYDKSDAELGFDEVNVWINDCFEWILYVIFFPIIYPLRLLGKRKRAELDAQPQMPLYDVGTILAEARRRNAT